MESGIPKQIGRYLIDRLLGAGAMGFVYLGRDPDLDRPVAIKTLRDMGLDDDALERFLERFRNEARAAARLQHPSIVQVYDVGEDEDAGPYLVFEYVAGSTLKRILRDRGALDPERVMSLADQVADALDTAHAHDIIHRDLKPDNLLVTPDGRTKLADFGVARVPNAALTREGQFLGTPCYAAPETLRSGRYGTETDLFSFAAVLYEAVSGVRAFPGDDAVAVANRVIHEDPPPPSEVAREVSVPPEVDEELMRGLSKDPDARQGSAIELAEALRAAYEQAGVLAPSPAGTRPETGRVRVRGTPPQPRRTGLLAFIAVLVGGLAVGVGLIFAFDGGGTPRTDAPDAGAPVTGRSAPTAQPVPQRTADDGPAAADAATDARSVLLDSDDEDAGSAVDTHPPESMTPHEREEAAKDAIARARRMIRASHYDQARQLLEEAERYDPGNPDIAQLRRQVGGRR